MKEVNWPTITELLSLLQTAADDAVFFDLVGELQCAIDRAVDRQLRAIASTPEFFGLSQSWRVLLSLTDQCDVEMGDFAAAEIADAEAVEHIKYLYSDRPSQTRGGRPYGLLVMATKMPLTLTVPVHQAVHIVGNLCPRPAEPGRTPPTPGPPAYFGNESVISRHVQRSWLAARFNAVVRSHPAGFTSVASISRFLKNHFAEIVNVQAGDNGYDLNFGAGESVSVVQEVSGLHYAPAPRAVLPDPSQAQAVVDAMAADETPVAESITELTPPACVAMGPSFGVRIARIDSLRATRCGVTRFELFPGESGSTRPGFVASSTPGGLLVRMTGRPLRGLVLHVARAGSCGHRPGDANYDLATSLSRAFSIPVSVYPSRRRVHPPNALGNWTLSASASDPHRLEVQLGPLRLNEFLRLRSGRPRSRRLLRTIAKHAPGPCRVVATMLPTTVRPWRLGLDRVICLGVPREPIHRTIGGTP